MQWFSDEVCGKALDEAENSKALQKMGEIFIQKWFHREDDRVNPNGKTDRELRDAWLEKLQMDLMPVNDVEKARSIVKQSIRQLIHERIFVSARIVTGIAAVEDGKNEDERNANIITELLVQKCEEILSQLRVQTSKKDEEVPFIFTAEFMHHLRFVLHRGVSKKLASSGGIVRDQSDVSLEGITTWLNEEIDDVLTHSPDWGSAAQNEVQNICRRGREKVHNVLGETPISKNMNDSINFVSDTWERICKMERPNPKAPEETIQRTKSGVINRIKGATEEVNNPAYKTWRENKKQWRLLMHLKAFKHAESKDRYADLHGSLLSFVHAMLQDIDTDGLRKEITSLRKNINTCEEMRTLQKMFEDLKNLHPDLRQIVLLYFYHTGALDTRQSKDGEDDILTDIIKHAGKTKEARKKKLPILAHYLPKHFEQTAERQ